MRRAGHRPDHARLGAAHRPVEDRGTRAGAGQVRLRPRLRRRPARRGEVPGQGAGILLPHRQQRWDPKNSVPSCGTSTTRRKRPGKASACSRCRTGPSWTSGSTSSAEKIPVVPLYFAAERPVVERDGALIMVDDDRLPLRAGEVPELRKVRFRTLGCYPLTGAVESDRRRPRRDHLRAAAAPRTSERQGRVIDHDSAGPWRRRSRRATSDDHDRQPEVGCRPLPGEPSSARTCSASSPAAAWTTARAR